MSTPTVPVVQATLQMDLTHAKEVATAMKGERDASVSKFDRARAGVDWRLTQWSVAKH